MVLFGLVWFYGISKIVGRSGLMARNDDDDDENAISLVQNLNSSRRVYMLRR